MPAIVRGVKRFAVSFLIVSGIGLPHVHGETVTYVQQIGNLVATFGDGGGSFNDGATRFGMYANFNGKPSVAWRDLKTAGDNGGSARSLQVGDLFTLTVNSTSAFGGMGFSLNDNGTQGSSYANRISGSRLFVQEVGTTASWEVNSGSGVGGYTSLNYNVGSTRRSYTFEVTLTSESTANVRMLADGVDNGNRAYNLVLNGAAGANIDAFSMWLADDWNGSSNQNIYWQQETSVENVGQVELGYYLASGTFTPGRITDGLAAGSTSTASVNQVFVGGDAGSQVNLVENNTYTGTTTINANAAGEMEHANALGSTAAGTTVLAGGALKLFSTSTIAYAAEPLTINGTGVSNTGGSLRHVGGSTTWTGPITLGSNSRINADIGGSLTISGTVAGGTNVLFLGANSAAMTISGAISGVGGDQSGTTTSVFKDGSGSLTLSGANTYSGATLINAGTLVAASTNALGSGAVTVSAGATLRLDAVVANAITTSGGSLSFAGGGLARTSNVSGGQGTVATLVAGTQAAPATLAPVTSWSGRPAGTYSDALSLTGTANTVQIVQLTYDPAVLGPVPETDLGLGWKLGASWVNAVNGNSGQVGGSAVINQNGSFASLGVSATAAFLGSWGRDTASNTVWAVVNHNSDFAVVVVPEPTALGWLGMACGGLLAWRRLGGGRRGA